MEQVFAQLLKDLMANPAVLQALQGMAIKVGTDLLKKLLLKLDAIHLTGNQQYLVHLIFVVLSGIAGLLDSWINSTLHDQDPGAIVNSVEALVAAGLIHFGHSKVKAAVAKAGSKKE
jgi:hypothetical protein